MKQNFKEIGLRLVLLLASVVYIAAIFWLHYQQLCAADGFASDLPTHLQFAQEGVIYSIVSVLILPVYQLFGYAGTAFLVSVFHLAAIAVFAWGLRSAAPWLSRSARLLTALVVNLAQAVWIPRGGYWYIGTVNGTIYHNTTYIMLAPFALLALLCFYRTWQGMSNGLNARDWLVYTVLLTIATGFKASFVFAFAPALLLLLIADLIRTRGRNLKREILLGCSVLPSIALCLLQSMVLFGGEGEGLQLIFSVDPVYFETRVISWGVFDEASRRGLLRSFVFIGAAAVLLGRYAWGSFRYRFSALVFAVAMAEALLLVERGERIGHANFWWGAFICFWFLFLESFCALVRGFSVWRARHTAWLGFRLAACGIALLWHIVSGVCFLVLLLQGYNYDIPIATYQLWF